MAIDKDWRRANWWDYPDDDDTPGLIQEDENINVYTQAEMIRMDMYFWDAGMAAFMDHMSMPGILDESIKKALLGKEYKED